MANAFTGVALSLSVASLWLAGTVARAAEPNVRAPQVVKAEPDQEWNQRFNGTKGWIGGDGAYSVELGPKRFLWLFGDSLIGVARDGKRSGATMVNNTAGIQDGVDKQIRFVWGTPKNGKPTALLKPAAGTGYFWPHAAIMDAGKLFVFLARIEKTSAPGAFGFKQIGEVLAVIDNPGDDPEKWRVKQQDVPFVEFTAARHRAWGAGLVAADGYLYVYGIQEQRVKPVPHRQLQIARAPMGKLADFSSWRFRTASGWSEKPSDANPRLAGLATEFSVSRLPAMNVYALVYTENGLGDRVLGRFATLPDGPWSEPVLLYRCPEMGRQKEVFTYAAKAHPWAAGGHELLVSYCVNTWDFWQIFKDDSVYRPKFVRVGLTPPSLKK